MNNYNNKSENDFRLFSKDLKDNNINGIIALYGQEGFLIKWAVEELVKKYVAPGFETLDFIKLSGDITTEAIIENTETMSMISPKRIIWVDDYRHILDEKTKGYSQDDIANLCGYLSAYSGDNIVVFSFENLDKKVGKLKTFTNTSYKFDKLQTKDLYAFIKKRMDWAGKTISRDSLELMVELSGYYNKESQYRLYNLQNDIEKIIAHSGDEAITEKDIKASMNGDLDSYVFDFIEALSTNQKDRTYNLMNNLLNSGSNFFQLIALIVNQFELMLEVLELDQKGMPFVDIVKEMSIHEFRVKKAFKAAQRFSVEKLKKILTNLYEIDRNIKSGNIDQKTALELFIARI